VLELFPIVAAAHVWGRHWLHFQIEFRSDNSAVVAILNSGTSRDPLAMHLIRRLSLVACQHHFLFSARHVPGHQNEATDALSRFQFQVFHHLHPRTNVSPTPILAALVDRLLFGI
jgi:hypothetical protein